MGIALTHVLIALKQEHDLSVFAVEEFFSLSEAIGPGAALYSSLVNEVIPISNESDIHGAVSLALLNAAKTEEDRVFSRNLLSGIRKMIIPSVCGTLALQFRYVIHNVRECIFGSLGFCQGPSRRRRR